MSCTVLLIDELPANASEQQVRGLLGDEVPVVSVTMVSRSPKTPGSAMVRLALPRTVAQMVARQLTGTHFDGRTLRAYVMLY